jgi:hypothetical protein
MSQSTNVQVEVEVTTEQDFLTEVTRKLSLIEVSIKGLSASLEDDNCFQVEYSKVIEECLDEVKHHINERIETVEKLELNAA